MSDMANLNCIFCGEPPSVVVAENELAVAFRDGFPVSPGHTLIVPRRHVADWFDASEQEQAAILELLNVRKNALSAELRPSGYNVGINCGQAAGQTVMHLHVHLIPRFEGDVDCPDGGVRFVIPEKGDYKSPGRIPQINASQQRLTKGGSQDPLWTQLRPLFAQASVIRIVAAFVQNSGVRVLDDHIQSAICRGCSVQIITGDYLNITQEQALRHLLLLQTAEALPDEELGGREARGQLEVRVVEIARIEARTFHPKAWMFSGAGCAVAFVGSSNMSRAALIDGVEWNLRVDCAGDATAYTEIIQAYEELWDEARTIDDDWLDGYAERAKTAARQLPPGEICEAPRERPEPRPIQEEALEALRSTRADGVDRGLAILATGLGKTWLAAFDFQQFRAERPGARLLFVAHRIEILRQAARTFQQLLPDVDVGFWVGGERSSDRSMVFASVQALRIEKLAILDPTEFDYVVIDEVHHAAADSYRAIMDTLKPGFWLGLTATPTRADGGDVIGQFDDNIVFEAGLDVGIRDEHLVPFRYFGLADTVDYSAARIPWRRGRFDQARLDAALRSEGRMGTAWNAWNTYHGTRTLVFCCSIEHAKYVRDYLLKRGVRVKAVHSGPGSDDRAEALEELAAGQLDAICSVDVFNEGVDVPEVDRVMMLRPTESNVVFLQQLGRGLRAAQDKEHLTVIDFVGNHRMFLERLRTLMTYASADMKEGLVAALKRAVLESPYAEINIDLEAIDLLETLIRRTQTNPTIRLFRELVDARGSRPSAAELARLGGKLKKSMKPWFQFLTEETQLLPEEAEVLDEHGRWFSALQSTSMSKCFKAVTLQVMLSEKVFWSGMNLQALADESIAFIQRSPGLRVDLNVRDNLESPKGRLSYWKKNPIRAWSGSEWFKVHDGLFKFSRDVKAEHQLAFRHMTEELIDYLIYCYRQREKIKEAEEGGGLAIFASEPSGV